MFFFFDLLIDEPVQHHLGCIILFFNSDSIAFVDQAGYQFFVFEDLFKDRQGGAKFNGRLLDGLQHDALATRGAERFVEAGREHGEVAEAGRAAVAGEQERDNLGFTRMRQRAAASDIVIVNHHLLCADAAVRQGTYGEVIPECACAVIDEAHQLEDVATQYFGFSVSTYRVAELVRDFDRVMSGGLAADDDGELGRAMNLTDCEVIHKRVMHPAEGTLIELKGRLDVAIDPATLVIPEPPEVLSDEEIREFVHDRGVRCVAATVGEDEHSVGMREIIDIKHGGLEKWGFSVTYLGTSVPIEKVLDAAIEHAATVVLISTIITHADVHREMMEKLASLAEEKGVREKLLLIAGGTQVTDEIACASGMDAGFGRRTKGIDVASFVVREMQERGL